MDIIRRFLYNLTQHNSPAGNSAYEMLQDGYNGNFDGYADDYMYDYELVTINGRELIRRIGYPEYYDINADPVEIDYL